MILRNIEILIYFSITGFVLYKLGAVLVLSKIGKFRLIFFVILSILLFSGQGIKNNRITYPFSYWGMYSSSNAPNTFIEYNIELSSGEKIHYPFEIITNYSPRAFMRKIENLLPPNAGSEEQLEELLLSLRNILEQQYPEKEVSKIIIERVKVPVNKWDKIRSLKKSTIHTLHFRNE